MPRKVRLDAELVSQGFFSSADEAMRAVMAGDVSGAGKRYERAGEQVVPGVELHVRGRIPYVSRGGLKLERGLEAFGVNPEGLACLDVGCSTGGFTDCLLRHGAAHVLAVDVGYAQFAWSLRTDERVELLERTRMEDLMGSGRADTIDLAVCDVSFTSVLNVADAVAELLKPSGRFLTLVKPQFEADRSEVGEGGVVRSQQVRDRAVAKVAEGLAEHGFDVSSPVESPIHGAKGNVEYLLLAQR